MHKIIMQFKVFAIFYENKYLVKLDKKGIEPYLIVKLLFPIRKPVFIFLRKNVWVLFKILNIVFHFLIPLKCSKNPDVLITGPLKIQNLILKTNSGERNQTDLFRSCSSVTTNNVRSNIRIS